MKETKDDFKFYSWFAGFCDAEANFQTTKFNRINKKGEITSIGLKYSFHIGLHLRDIDLLKLIQFKLNNMGKIYEYRNKEEAHYAIYKVDELKWLIEKIFSIYPLISLNQRLRYLQLRKGIINNLKKIDTLDDYQNILVNQNSLPEIDYSTLSLVADAASEIFDIKNQFFFFLESWTCGFFFKRRRIFY